MLGTPFLVNEHKFGINLRDFVLGTRYGANFCVHHMCLYPKGSDFLGEFKNAQSDFLLLLGPLCMGQDKLNNFASHFLSFSFLLPRFCVAPRGRGACATL